MKQLQEIQEIKEELKEITIKLDNHLLHVAKDISQIQNDLDWIRRFFWLLASTSVTAIVGAILALILN